MSFRFIAGSDDFLVQRKAAQEWNALCTAVGDADAAETIDGHAGTVDDVSRAVSQFISAVQTVSMFAPNKAVWFKGINFLADSVTGRANGTLAEIERLQALLENFDSQNVHVLLSAAPVDRRKKAYKWFTSAGNATFLESGTDAQTVIALVQDEAKAFGTRFSAEAAAILAEKVGKNTRMALEETRKLATYLGATGGEITAAMVTELVPALGESDFFETTEAFFELNLEWTLAAIQRHFFAGNESRSLLAGLQNRNRLLIQLKALLASGAIRGRVSKQSLDNTAKRHAHYFHGISEKTGLNLFTQNPWYLAKLSGLLDRLTLRDLLLFQEAFRDAFIAVINRPDEEQSVMRAMAIHCIGATGKQR